MAVITRTRGKANVGRPARVPVYDADLSVTWDALMTLEPYNRTTAKVDAEGVRGSIRGGHGLTDVSGIRVGMLTMAEDGEVYRDAVTVRGSTNTGIIVEFDDEPGIYYTVRRSAAKLVRTPRIQEE